MSDEMENFSHYMPDRFVFLAIHFFTAIIAKSSVKWVAAVFTGDGWWMH